MEIGEYRKNTFRLYFVLKLTIQNNGEYRKITVRNYHHHKHKKILLSIIHALGHKKDCDWLVSREDQIPNP